MWFECHVLHFGVKHRYWNKIRLQLSFGRRYIFVEPVFKRFIFVTPLNFCFFYILIDVIGYTVAAHHHIGVGYAFLTLDTFHYSNVAEY